MWAASLREIKKRIRPLFKQERVATNAGLFLEGLLGDEQRKTGWMRAEAAGDPGPWRQQAILGRRDWDADALRDIVRDYVIEHLADDDAVLVIDETGFLKQGKASCGVARQYTGSAGKITNCQIGVFAAYVSRHGHAFIDRALYLPKEWTDDPDRLEAAYVPADAGFATKPKLATRMIARAIAASVPFKWVAGDTVYGVGDIEQQLRRAGKGYVLGVSSAHVFRSWANGGRSPARPRTSPGPGARPTGSACLREPEPKDRGCMIGVISNWPISRPKQFNSANDGLWTRGLLIRRRIADGDLAFFTTWCQAGTSIETLVWRPRRAPTTRRSRWSMRRRRRSSLRRASRRARPSASCSAASASGLENHEVALADRIVTLPVNPAFASLNLGQAVVVIAYEWFKLAGRGALPFAMPRTVAAGDQAAVAGVFQIAGTASWKRSSSSARPTSATPCRSICATSSRAWQLTQQDIRTLHGVITAIAEGRKGPARGGMLNGDEAALLRTLLAEHGQGRVPNERGPVRGLARLLRRNPTEAERTFWDALMRDRRFVGQGFKRQVPVGPHITDIVSFPLRIVIELVPRRRESRPAPRRAPSGGRGSPSAAIAWSTWRWRRSRRTSAKVLDGLAGSLRDQPFSVLSCAAVPARRKPRSLPTARKRTPRLAQATARSALAQ